MADGKRGAKTGGSADDYSAAETSDPLPARSASAGGAWSGSITLRLQTRPVGAKFASTLPSNGPSARLNRRDPKPLWLGGLTGGPSLSRQAKFSRVSDSDQ